jgi:hypothetical protein
VCDNFQCCVQDPAYCTGKCGSTIDNCGVPVSCGNDDCGDGTGGDVCIANVCCSPEAAATTCSGLECGVKVNNCGQDVDCDAVAGGCTAGDSCVNNLCVSTTSSKPTPANTGASNPGILTPYTGPTNITTNGTVIENFTYDGTITVNADNVVIRNGIINLGDPLPGGCRADGGSNGSYGIHMQSGDNLLVEDVEIKNMDSAGIFVGAGTNSTFRRLHVHESCGDAFKLEGSGHLVEASFIERLGAGAGAHADGFQIRGGSNMTFIGNNCWMPINDCPDGPGDPYKSNACFIIENNSSNFLIQENWLNGGGYTLAIDFETVTGLKTYGNYFGAQNGYGLGCCISSRNQCLPCPPGCPIEQTALRIGHLGESCNNVWEHDYPTLAKPNSGECTAYPNLPPDPN